MPKPKSSPKTVASKRISRRPTTASEETHPYEASEFNLRLMRWRLSGARAADEKDTSAEMLPEAARKELLQNSGALHLQTPFSDEIEDGDGRNVSAWLVEEGAEATEFEEWPIRPST